MKKIQFTKHIANRIKIRHISRKLVLKIFENPQDIFEDILNQTKVAVKKEKEKYYMLAYIDNIDVIKIITIHPIKKSQIQNRLKTGRWVKEKKLN